jgi:nucleoside triphosphate pyrophosphatase
VSDPLLLASTSPQRRAILEQLRIPFEAVAPRYDESWADPWSDPFDLVRAHARGKARSVTPGAGSRPVLGVDTEVVWDGRVRGKPEDEAAAAAMLGSLAGETHEVVSGLCLVGPGWEELGHAVTRVTFRSLTRSEIAAYLESGEWRDRAGGYAVQGLGARLVKRVEGDYLNVVGLPAALLCDVLAARFPGLYGLG